MRQLPAALLGVCGFLALTAPARSQEMVISNLSLLERLSRETAAEIAAGFEADRSIPLTVISTTPHEGNGFLKRMLAQALVARGYRVTVARGAGEIDTVSTVTASGPATPSARGPAARTGGAAQPDETSLLAPVQQLAATSALDEAGVATDSLEAPAPTLEPAPLPSPPPPFQVTAGATVPLGVYPEGITLDVQLLEFGVHYSEVGRRYYVGPVTFTRVAGVYTQVSALEGRRGELRDVYSAQRHHWDRVTGRQRVLAEGAAYPFTSPELRAPGVGNYVEPAVVVGIVGSLIYLFYANQN